MQPKIRIRFSKLDEKFRQAAEIIVKNNGICLRVLCAKCPFSTPGIGCVINSCLDLYDDPYIGYVESAKEYLRQLDALKEESAGGA